MDSLREQMNKMEWNKNKCKSQLIHKETATGHAAQPFRKILFSN